MLIEEEITRCFLVVMHKWWRKGINHFAPSSPKSPSWPKFSKRYTMKWVTAWDQAPAGTSQGHFSLVDWAPLARFLWVCFMFRNTYLSSKGLVFSILKSIAPTPQVASCLYICIFTYLHLMSLGYCQLACHPPRGGVVASLAGLTDKNCNLVFERTAVTIFLLTQQGKEHFWNWDQWHIFHSFHQ